jgi:hypothetical protein
MIASTVAALALLGCASAQSTVSLFLPMVDAQDIDASIIGTVRILI